MIQEVLAQDRQPGIVELRHAHADAHFSGCRGMADTQAQGQSGDSGFFQHGARSFLLLWALFSLALSHAVRVPRPIESLGEHSHCPIVH
ncbi:hypothetical protein D9M71_605060 [compost metagenome]